MKKLLFTLSLLLIFTGLATAQKTLTVVSPNGKLKAEISIGDKIEYRVLHEADLMLDKSPVSLQLADGRVLGQKPKLLKSVKKAVNTSFDAVIYKKNKVADHYNELTLLFKGNFSVIFRAYDDGVAYRFSTDMKTPFEVENEQATFNFADNYKVYAAFSNNWNGKDSSFEKQFANSHESHYEHFNLSEWNKHRLAMSPMVVEAAKGKKVCILEADLLNYPGMYLNNNDGSNSLKGVFATYPKEMKKGGGAMHHELVQTREKFIAKCAGKTAFPWRAVVVAANDYELANSDMVYKLATPTQLSDLSWIKPGKVAWDWWNDFNVYGVDFESGVNNDTYKYYIDFASEHGIEYVILDEGWAVARKMDLFQIVPEIDLKELVAYAKTRNVSLILWAGYNSFNADVERVCKHYSEMGIKGFKVDFMDRDDQLMVDFQHRAAKIAAKYKLLIDFHGTYKPAGLQRTYPNIINFEGVYGLEQMKWAPSSVDQVTYDVILPFIRQVAGPLDYTQGAMRNATKNNYRPVWNEAMSQGTRCRQLAEYVIFESPLNMLCDNPSNYIAEKECTEFIAKIPTTWDETVAMNGEIAKYVTIARRKGNEWYVGSMTNWDKRTLELDLSFLGNGNFKAEIFRDGINANRVARDYKKEVIDIPANRKLTIQMAQGGGFAMKITSL